MKRILLSLIAIFAVQAVMAQITITASDMPVAGDTLRFSTASPLDSNINLTDTGASVAWNYSLTPVSQAVDSYQLAASVNILYIATVGLTASGYKVADSLPGLGAFLPVSIQNIYTFFEVKSSPSRYQAQAFAASISGLPTAIPYTNADVWYFFPLDYSLGRTDSAHYKLNISLPSVGGIDEVGYRKSRVDGWGTITTPYYTTPVNCIRVRSEIHETDSISFGTFPAIGFPRNTVEYKWLVNGDHYPALWVTTNVLPGGGGETVSNIKYRDKWRDTTAVNHVANVQSTPAVITASPNPATSGLVTLGIPAGWKHFTVAIYDMQSKQVAVFADQKEINIGSLPAGSYIGQVVCGANTGYVKIVR